MVNILILIAAVFFSPVKAHAMVFTDPVASFQRKLQLAYDSLEASRTVVLLQDTWNNLQTAKMTYDLARAGYEKVTNPKEWEALAEYSKYRLKALANPTPDPYQTVLYKTVVSMDRAADAYIMNTKAYGAMANATGGFGESLGRADQNFGDKVTNNTPNLYALKDASDWKTLEWGTEAGLRDSDNRSRRYIALSLQQSQQLGARLGTIRSRAIDLAEEMAKLQKMEFYAEQGYQLALQKTQESGLKPEKAKAAGMRLEKAGRMKDDILTRIKRIQEEMSFLSKEGQSLTDDINENNKNLDTNAAALGFEDKAKRLIATSSLSRGAQSESNVKMFRTTSFTILAISLSCAILWKGVRSFSSPVGDALPHEAVFGMIAAVMFLLPSSPVRIENVAKHLSILVDTVETSIFKSTMDQATSRWTKGFSDTIGAITAPGPATSNKRVKEAWENEMEKMNESSATGVWSAIKTVSAIGFGPALTLSFLQSVGVLMSFLGVVAVAQSFALRELAYWVLMTVAPLFIAMAPLDFARKKLLPSWGMSLYAVIMWGPITKAMLMLSNSRAGQTLDIVGNLVAGNTTSAVLGGFYQGVLLVFLMLLSPFIAYKLAQGSFDGLVASLGAAGIGAIGATAAGALTMGKATQALGRALPTIGKGVGAGASGVGKIMENIAGPAKIDKGPLSGSIRPTFAKRSLANVGKGLQVAGQFMMKSSNAVSNYTRPKENVKRTL